MSQTYLITGGTGYIGSHTVVALIESGQQVVILDNLANSKREVVNRIECITGVRPELAIGDIRDRALLRSLFANHAIDAVLHFAGLKAVGDSEKEVLAYFDNNVSGSITTKIEWTGVDGSQLLCIQIKAKVGISPKLRGVGNYTQEDADNIAYMWWPQVIEENEVTEEIYPTRQVKCGLYDNKAVGQWFNLTLPEPSF